MRKHYARKQRSQLAELVTSGHATVAEAAARSGRGGLDRLLLAEAGHVEGLRLKGAQSTERAAVETGSGATFVRLVSSSAVAAAITVRVGRVEVEVRRGFDDGLLRAVVAALDEGAK